MRSKVLDLSKETVEEYQKIFKKEYGKDITYEEAHEQGLRLINFMKLLFELEYGENAYMSGEIVIGEKKYQTVSGVSKEKLFRLIDRDIKRKLYEDEVTVRNLLKAESVSLHEKFIQRIIGGTNETEKKKS